MKKTKSADIGLIGLAVMGANLARNIAGKKFSIVVYNRTTERTNEFIKEFGHKYLSAENNLKDFVATLKIPRKIIIMVKAGEPVDEMITQLIPLLSKNDIIIDCGNSNYNDTKRRNLNLKKHGLNFVGCGVSGGEEGALHGPSIMPGGDKQAVDKILPILQKIAAKDFSGKPCVTYIGENGAGHYVKMVHNGIEYGVMQMMAEAYEMLRTVHKLPAPKIAKIFQKFNQGKLKSYLFEIAVEVLNKKDEFKKGWLIDHILDKAGQKGTGQWTGIDSLTRAVSLPTITEAVYARINSGEKTRRLKISKLYPLPKPTKKIPLQKFTKLLEDALYAGMLSSYAQGYTLIKKTAFEESWKINLAEVSRIWEGGCIIRAKILNDLHKAFAKNSNLHLFEIPSLAKTLKSTAPSLRTVVSYATASGIPIPSLATAQSYFESMRSANLSANFIQGLRDYFGAHTYERTDKKGIFHTHWN